MATPIRVRAHKTDRARPRDVVVIEHAGRATRIEAWRQAILPHELVHAAVESAFGLAGFVRQVARGRDPATIGARDPDPEVALSEALTNAFQYELAGLAEPGDEALLATLATFLAGTPGVREVRAEELARCRGLLLDLSARWAALAPGGSIEVELEAS